MKKWPKKSRLTASKLDGVNRAKGKFAICCVMGGGFGYWQSLLVHRLSAVLIVRLPPRIQYCSLVFLKVSSGPLCPDKIWWYKII